MTVRCTSVLQSTRIQRPFPYGITALQNVASWLNSSRLRLNQAKAALTWLQQSTQQMKKIGKHVVPILLSFITTVKTARDIGVIMDNDLTVSAHISSVCRPASDLSATKIAQWNLALTRRLVHEPSSGAPQQTPVIGVALRARQILN